MKKSFQTYASFKLSTVLDFMVMLEYFDTFKGYSFSMYSIFSKKRLSPDTHTSEM